MGLFSLLDGLIEQGSDIRVSGVHLQSFKVSGSRFSIFFQFEIGLSFSDISLDPVFVSLLGQLSHFQGFFGLVEENEADGLISINGSTGLSFSVVLKGFVVFLDGFFVFFLFIKLVSFVLQLGGFFFIDILVILNIFFVGNFPLFLGLDSLSCQRSQELNTFHLLFLESQIKGSLAHAFVVGITSLSQKTLAIFDLSDFSTELKGSPALHISAIRISIVLIEQKGEQFLILETDSHNEGRRDLSLSLSIGSVRIGTFLKKQFNNINFVC
mmetsp:Transcript_15514/g.13265  ORF Transcript_15514/g.13265 Transcript_15514/m.13265 type:complete len:269 (+) Transcript_15514:177-983(+)